MRKTLVIVALAYLHLALVGRFVERVGAVRCGCAASCWCHRPVLSTFRWVLPLGHTPADEAIATA